MVIRRQTDENAVYTISGSHRVYWRNAGWPDNVTRPSSTNSQNIRTHAPYHHAQPVEGHMGINAPALPSCSFFSFLSARACLLPLFFYSANGTLLSRRFSETGAKYPRGAYPLAVIANSLPKRRMMLRGLNWKRPLLARATARFCIASSIIFQCPKFLILSIQQYYLIIQSKS